MEQTTIHTSTSTKPLPRFLCDLEKVLTRNGFLIHNRESMNLAQAFARHDLEVEPDFDLHMIQLCKPGKAAVSLGRNPRRAALMPKFIMAFSEEGLTRVQFLTYGREDIARLVEDQTFADSLAETYRVIIELIEASC